MANETESATPQLVPFTTPPDVDRVRSGLPWGMCVHEGIMVLDTHLVSERIQLNFPLPTNFVYRLAHLALETRVNSGDNEYFRSPLLQLYWSPTGENAASKDYPMTASWDGTSDSNIQYVMGGYGVSSANISSTGGFSTTSAINDPSNLLITSIPQGVGTWDPNFRVTTASNVSTGGLHYRAVWHAFNIEQRNHVAVNYRSPTTF